MKVIKGDLIKLAKAGEFDVIIHGCNCFCTMGNGPNDTGIAGTIKRVFPEVYAMDLGTLKGDRNKLGTVIGVGCKNDNGGHLLIFNAYTQYNYGKYHQSFEYWALRSCFAMINRLVPYPELRIGYPKIGAGLAKGDWSIISEIIDQELDGRDHTLVERD